MASTALTPVTWLDLTRSVAWEFGHDISHEVADHLLWEHTGFPAFWTGDPRKCAIAQLRAYFAGEEPVLFREKP